MCWPTLIFDEVDSTNSFAEKLVDEGGSPPFVVCAYTQNGGRGRYGHTWYSPRGGCYMSIAVKGDLRDWTFFSALATLRSILSVLTEPKRIPIEIKIPNDVLIDGKKVAGILGEMHHGTTIVGIGVNLNQGDFPRELKNRAISLYMWAGKEYPVDIFIDLLIFELQRVDRMLRLNRKTLFQEWKSWVGDVGKIICFEKGTKRVTGTLKDITEDFGLLMANYNKPFDLFSIRNMEWIK